MKNYILTLITFLVMGIGFTQTYPKMYILNGDTVFCFTVEQTKKMASDLDYLQTVTKGLEVCEELDSVKTKEIERLVVLSDNKTEEIKMLSVVIKNSGDIINGQKEEINLYKTELGIVKGKLLGQKISNGIGWSLFGIATGFAIYLGVK